MPNKKAPRFLLVEDQLLMREMLRARLLDQYAGCEIVEKQSLAELQKIDKKEVFDLAIVDLLLPDGNALNWVLQWIEQPGEPRVLLLTSSDEDYILHRAFQSRVQGFVHKNDDTASLMSAIDTVLSGRIHFSEKIQKMRARMGSDPLFFSKILSAREQSILEHLAKGLRNDEIGKLLKLSPTTVQDHRSKIMAKLEIHREADLIRYANQKGFGSIKQA